MDETQAATSQRDAPGSGDGVRRLVGMVAGLAAIAALGWWLRGSIESFLEWVRGAGAIGMGAYVVAYVVACVLFLPGVILTLGAGLVYGVAVGVPLAWIGATLGSTAAFVLGRTVAREWVASRVAAYPRFAAIDRAVGREGRRIVFLTRLSPVFPFNLLNYAYGITSVGLRDYVLGAFGMLPGTLLYVYLGSFATNVGDLGSTSSEGGAAKFWLRVVGLFATLAVTVVVTRIARRARELVALCRKS